MDRHVPGLPQVLLTGSEAVLGGGRGGGGHRPPRSGTAPFVVVKLMTGVAGVALTNRTRDWDYQIVDSPSRQYSLAWWSLPSSICSYRDSIDLVNVLRELTKRTNAKLIYPTYLHRHQYSRCPSDGVLKTIVTALVISRVQYCLTVYGNGSQKLRPPPKNSQLRC